MTGAERAELERLQLAELRDRAAERAAHERYAATLASGVADQMAAWRSFEHDTERLQRLHREQTEPELWEVDVPPLGAEAAAYLTRRLAGADALSDDARAALAVLAAAAAAGEATAEFKLSRRDAAALWNWTGAVAASAPEGQAPGEVRKLAWALSDATGCTLDSAGHLIRRDVE